MPIKAVLLPVAILKRNGCDPRTRWIRLVASAFIDRNQSLRAFHATELPNTRQEACFFSGYARDRSTNFAICRRRLRPLGCRKHSGTRPGQRWYTLANISCLGLHRVLARRTDVGFDSHSYALRDLPFPSEPELICCTVGSVAEHLARRLNLGAQTLQDALARWLIERHAAQLVQAIQGGKINVWVQLFDNDDERRAYQSLLAQSSDSVSVHDLVGG